jgi:uncharacterized protein (DUF924 family)
MPSRRLKKHAHKRTLLIATVIHCDDSTVSVTQLTWILDQYPLWFAGGKEVDAAITTQFGPDLQRLDQDKQAYDAWFTDDMNPRAGLAAIILTDQMSRNIFRGCSECFQYDRFARDWTHRLLDSGRYRELRPVELSFALMPLEHSEDLKHHRRHAEMLDQAIAECQSHGSEAAKAMSKSLINFKKFLADHSQVVEQFGRYPHRNKVLGRTNTPEEETYLKDGGASWGQ